MKVLITGAAGFLGRAFTKRHFELGDDVWGVDNLSSGGSYWPPIESDRRWTMDLGDLLMNDGPGYGLEKADGFDLAYHFAAPVGGRLKIEGDPLFNADSLRLDSAFFRWAVKHVKQVVYPSSSAVYGTAYQGNDALLLHEEMFDPAGPVWAAPDEMYGFTKMAGEVLAWKSAAYGLNTLCIRPFSGYGEGQSLDYPVPSIAQRALNKDDPLVVWGSGYQTRDFVHVIDLVEATVKRAQRGTTGYAAMNIATGVETSFVKIAQMCAEIADYDPEIITDESKPEGVTRRFGYAGRMLVHHKPQIDLYTGLERVMAWLSR